MQGADEGRSLYPGPTLHKGHYEGSRIGGTMLEFSTLKVPSFLGDGHYCGAKTPLRCSYISCIRLVTLGEIATESK